ncbi:MAG: GNAT family N-acetyltransferase [Actinomycetota bacterium]|nr:GNAT family N-acetyltransferase [Actinomycetota bacterium]
MTLPPADVAVRRVREEDWAQVRELRLRMLRDTPSAFLERYDDAAAAGERVWRSRARDGASGTRSVRFTAVAADGTWVGTMGGFVQRPGDVTLVGVFVDPAYRGRRAGVADGLLRAVQAWAVRDAGARTMTLLVHEDNGRAQAYYRRHGFTDTGRRVPYPLQPAQQEIEMVRPLP